MIPVVRVAFQMVEDFDVTERGSSNFPFLCKLDVEIEIVVWFLTTGSFFEGLEAKQLLFVKILLIGVFDVLDGREDFLGLWADKFRKNYIDITF